RPVDRPSTEGAIGAVNATVSILRWIDDYTVEIALDGPFGTSYTLSVNDTGRDRYDHAFIPWQITFATATPDVVAPAFVRSWPLDGSNGHFQLLPITVEFDEELGTELP